MRLYLTSLLLLLTWTLPCLSQEKDKIPLTVKGFTIYKNYPVVVTAPPDIGFYRWSYPPLVKATDKGNVLELTSGPSGEVRVELKVEYGVYDEAAKKIKYVTEFTSVSFEVLGGVIPVPPTPTPPTPVPPDPKPPTPVPVSSFRVIFVYETAKTLTIAQLAAMDSKLVRDYLYQNTTAEGGYAGYRKYDKDQDSSKDTPTINAMWQATKPLVTSVPCVAVEVNGRVEIVPLEPTAAAMVDVFKKYKGGQ